MSCPARRLPEKPPAFSQIHADVDAWKRGTALAGRHTSSELKKKRVGKFKELGFKLYAELQGGLDELALLALADRLLDVVEARRLHFGGSAGGEDELEGFVTRDGRGSATEDDRTALASFLERDQSIVRREVGALRDAWYGFAILVR